MITPLELAVFFHDTYEHLAPSYGYETREDTKNFDPNSRNGQLMVAVSTRVIGKMLSEQNPSVINEIGNRYGKLTVLYQVPNERATGAAWMCQCDCGNTEIRLGANLRRNGATSCHKCSSRIINETGNVYTNLTVIKRAENSPSGKTMWLCGCSLCGSKVVLNGTALRQGKHTGCGCDNVVYEALNACQRCNFQEECRIALENKQPLPCEN